jgi:hypothetical protein
VLWFERHVVRALMSPGLDEGDRAQIERYVDSTLQSMPEHLRAGVAAESLVLGAPAQVARAFGRFDAPRLQRQIARWRASRVDPIRQYVRLLHSLVLFAENELTPA